MELVNADLPEPERIGRTMIDEAIKEIVKKRKEEVAKKRTGK
jgi:hypothetical protein